MRLALALLGCVVLTIASAELNKDELIVRDYMKNKIDRPDTLVQQPPAPEEVDNHQYTKFPSWVVTEDDMEAFFKQQKTKVIRKNTGVPAKKAKAAPESELVQEFTKFPSWVETEDDMEAYFKQQHTKVVRRDTGNKQKGNNDKQSKAAAPVTALYQKYQEKKDKDDPFAWAHLEKVDPKPKESLFRNSITDALEEDNKVDLDAPKPNSYEKSAILGGEQKRIEDEERQRLIESEYDDEDELIQDLLTPEH